jgi:uncharacterized protein YutE (UPF0331/DUF86 family)
LKQRPQQWFTIEIKSAINRRDFLKKKFDILRTKGIINNELFDEYKRLRNFVVKIIRQVKENRIYSLIEKCEPENQNIWSVVSHYPNKKQ